MDSGSTLKRKSSSSQYLPNSKRRLIDEPPLNILNFSDCILLQILKLLDYTSLYILSQTCHRFSSLIKDQSLWLYVDGRSHSNTEDKIEFYWKNVNEKTKHLFLAADSRSQFILSRHNMFESDTLSSLTVLSLEHQYIKYVKLSDFPRTLEELSFRHSYITRHAYFFRFSEQAMSNLKTLILDHCQWLDADCLTSLCKYPKLEILSLYMCKKLGEDDIANISLAGRFGFKSLKVLDLRFTGFGDLFIKTFCTKPTVQIVYFQCISTTYRLDRYQRKLDILNGASVDENSYMSDDDANDTTAQSLKKRFHATKIQKYDGLNIKDDSMLIFSQLKKASDVKTRPNSVLYKYPYSTCMCGNKPKEIVNETTESNQLRTKLQLEHTNQKKHREKRTGGNIYFLYPNCSSICSNIMFDSCQIPNWCHTESTPTSPSQKWLITREPKNDFEIAMLENTDKYLQSRVMRKCSLEHGCQCPGTSMRDNLSIDPLHSYNSDIARIYRGTSKQLTAHNCNVRFIKMLTNGITLLKSCPDPKTEATNFTTTFIKEFYKDIKLKDSEILKDTAFIEEIASIIYKLSIEIKYDVKSVMNYHLICFDVLLCFAERQRAPKRNLQTFFYNLLMAETKENLGKAIPEPAGVELARIPDEGLDLDEEDIPQGFRRLPDDVDPPQVQRVLRELLVINPAVAKEEKTPTAIRELSFRGYSHITDTTLIHLRDLELEVLDVTGTNVTEQGAQQFASYNPKCWLIHESVCVCRPDLHF